MLPKRFSRFTVRNPIRLHVIQSARIPRSSQYLSNVLERARRVAILFVGAIAVVGPEAMNGPAVRRASHRVGVPELDLLDEATGGFVAAGVGRDGACLAGELGVRAVFRLAAGWGGGSEL